MPIQSEPLEPRTLLAATLMPLVSFTGINGDTPHTVVQDNSGDLIGITRLGGANGFGEIFRLPKADNPQLEILYSFTGGADGRDPISLAMNAGGDIFGTTELGGANSLGTLFKLARDSTTVETLASLDNTTTGAKLAPFTDPAGNLYGVVTPGTVFRVSAGTNAITPITFVQGNVNDLIIDPSGNLFGTTFLGGSESFGSIFTIPAGSSSANTVASFTAAVGTVPNGLVVDSAGNLYGSTQSGGANGMGGVFRVLQGTSTIELLGSFDGTNGNQPGGKPALDDHGHLFGITRQGGANDSGTFYKLPARSNTILPVISLGPNETTIPAFANSFGDIQQPIVADVRLDLGPNGWHPNYPPPPLDEPPDGADDDIPDDDEITVTFPAGGPPVVPGSPGGKGSISWAATDDDGIPPPASSPFNVSISVPNNFPANAVGGGPARLPVKVNIRNDTDAAIARSASTVRLLLSTDGQVAGATEIATASPRLSLRPDQSKAVTVRITQFPNLPQGSYQLVAQVTDASSNTASGTGPSVALAPPFVSTAISNFNPAKPTARAGKRASFALTLTNNGNVDAIGSVAVTTATITPDPAGAGGQSVIVAKPLRVRLKPAAQRTLRISLTLPADLAPGAYFVSAALDVAALGDATPANGLALTLTPLTVS